MKNELSTSGIGEDIVRAFVQFGATEMHLKTLYEKTLAEMENGIIDVTDAEALMNHTEKMNEYREDLSDIAQLRRRTMKALFDLYPSGDRDAWCLVKHLGIGSMQMFEAWQASDNNVELLDIAVESNKVFTKALSRFVGAEITDCASCMSDFFKAGETKE